MRSHSGVLGERGLTQSHLCGYAGMPKRFEKDPFMGKVLLKAIAHFLPPSCDDIHPLPPLPIRPNYPLFFH